MSRAENSKKNILTGYASQILVILLNFAVRTVFIRTLGKEYLGINGLFSNILTLLSLAELGVGSAIIFKLYKPLEEHNEPRIIALMKLYRLLYAIVGCVIAFFGICLIPFLPKIINGYEKLAALHINPVLILLLYVFNSASSYWFFAYKQSIVKADQKTYLLTIRGYVITLLSSVTQILVLLIWKSFILYTLTMCMFGVIRNIVFARVADKYYPYLKKKVSERITKEEIKDLFRDCASLLLFKLNYTFVSTTDNIIISSYLGLAPVGLYSNYVMLVYNIRMLIKSFFESIEASLGSLHASGNLKWQQNAFKMANFVAVLIYGISGICIAVLCDDFIEIWIGKNYIIDSFTYGGITYYCPIAILFGFEVFTIGYTVFLSSFRNSFGLFQQIKIRPVLGVIINLVVGIILTPIIGVGGTVLGTIACNMLTVMIIDPIVIIDTSLHFPKRCYFLRNALYIAVTLLAGTTAWFVCKHIPCPNFFMLFVRGAVCVTVSCCIYMLFFFKSEEMKMLLTFLPKKGKLL